MKWEPRTISHEYQDKLLEVLPHAKWCDLDGHGYNVVEINPERITVEYWHVETVLKRSSEEFMASAWEVCHGDTRARRLH